MIDLTLIFIGDLLIFAGGLYAGYWRGRKTEAEIWLKHGGWHQ